MKLDKISLDLIAFSKSMMFHLSITEVEMSLLVLNKQEEIIEKLVFSNALFLTDQKSLDVDEILQVELLRRKETDKNAVKKQHIQQKRIEREKLKKQLSMTESKQKSTQKEHKEKDDFFEGGGQSERSQKPPQKKLKEDIGKDYMLRMKSAIDIQNNNTEIESQKLKPSDNNMLLNEKIQNTISEAPAKNRKIRKINFEEPQLENLE